MELKFEESIPEKRIFMRSQIFKDGKKILEIESSGKKFTHARILGGKNFENQMELKLFTLF